MLEFLLKNLNRPRNCRLRYPKAFCKIALAPRCRWTLQVVGQEQHAPANLLWSRTATSKEVNSPHQDLLA